MKTYLEMEINKIKNIDKFKIEIPLEKGLYAIVGSNGSGKSTIMLTLSQIVKKSSLKNLSRADFVDESYIKFTCSGNEDYWFYNRTLGKWYVRQHQPLIHFDGFYEGSIFYGTRFSDAAKSEHTLPELMNNNYIVNADDFIIEKLSMIMHDNKNYYKGLKRIKNRNIADKYTFKGMPYFYETKQGLISQLAMSSGECMLITLLHFVYNVLVRGNYKRGTKIIFLIDEVELALHPSAINRLINFIEGLVREYELIAIFSSHSAEVIRKINPRNMFQIENDEGLIKVNNPCYPSYAIRDLYSQDGFDYLILVEDELAKRFLNSIIMKNNLFCSKLIHVLPVGDWYNNLRLHNDIFKNNVLGFGKKILSILDGDVIKDVNDKDDFKHLPKLFLPLKSLEKYLYNKFIVCKDKEFIKYFGDKYFRVRSITDILNDYKSNYEVEKDKNGKKLYDMITSNLFHNGIDENSFLNYFCDDLLKFIDTKKFEEKLKSLVS